VDAGDHAGPFRLGNLLHDWISDAADGRMPSPNPRGADRVMQGGMS